MTGKPAAHHGAALREQARALAFLASLLAILLAACSRFDDNVSASIPAPAPTVAYRLQSEAHPLSPAMVAAQGQKHTVRAGENLSTIAATYGIHWTMIAALNDLDDPDQLQIGQRLVVPVTRQGSRVSGPQDIASDAPEPVAREKEIVVKLNEQRIYAYERGQVVYEALVSTGLPDTPTIQGEFAIYDRYAVQAMRGPDYDLPRVPYVLYFYETYSLHGTYWHHNFGEPMSHGCVNLSIHDARWFYNWSDIGTTILIEP